MSMGNIQQEFDDVSAHSCARCGTDLMEEGDPQYDYEIGNVCHKCWHILYPTTFCLVCSQAGAEDAS